MTNMTINTKSIDLILSGVLSKDFNNSKALGTPHEVHNTSEEKVNYSQHLSKLPCNKPYISFKIFLTNAKVTVMLIDNTFNARIQ